MPPYRGRGRGRYHGRGQGRMNNENREGKYACFYCQTPSHMSRDCPMRLRHQAEKRGGLDRANNGLAFAHIMCDLVGTVVPYEHLCDYRV